MRTKILFIIAVFACTSVYAQVISESEALNMAQQFMQNRQFVNVAKTRQAAINPEYYIFNAENDGGFVIVSGDKRTRKSILGYSEKGHFDYDNLPSNAKAWIDGYAEEIRILRGESGEKEVFSRTDGDYPASVSPLLGDTEWGQDSPFNDMCPTINDEHVPSGCVATALSQVMYYYKWPAQGSGIVEGYVVGGKEVNEATDLSKSTYQWDLMLPKYTSETSKESREAVALLLHDIGRAIHMNYDLSESGASRENTIPALYTNFDYDKGVRILQKEYCSTEMWENVLRNEISNGRPVLYSGGSTGGGHTFICDGYDDKGYFYFNYGWNGESNGYYLTSATMFNLSQDIIYGIEKNKGGESQLSLMSKTDFMYDDSKSEIACQLAVVCTADQVPIELAIAATNLSTNKTDYYIQKEDVSDPTPSGDLMAKFTSLSFNDNLEDGTYQIYPVCRVKGKEWETFYFADNRQCFIDLTVQDGKKTYANNNINGETDSGTIEIDVIYYKLNESEKTATVTYKNDKYNSYEGYVVIPDEVSYNNVSYPVTEIGLNAFQDCEKLDSVQVGSNVKRIDVAFYRSQLTKIHFAEKSNLWSISAFAFQSSELSEIELPYGFETLGNNLFECCFRLKKVVIPSTVVLIGKHVFNGCGEGNPFEVYVGHATPVVPNGKFTSSEDAPKNWTLYVPKGSLDAYKNAEYWKDFGTIKEMSEEQSSNIYDARKDYSCFDVYSLTGTLVRLKASNLDGLSNGVYIVVPSGEPWIGKNACKKIKN